MADWLRFARRLGRAGEVGYRRGGQVRWAADLADGPALTSQVVRAAGRGHPVRANGRAELCRLLPAARPVVAAPQARWRLEQPDGSRGSITGPWKLISVDARTGAAGGARMDRAAHTEQTAVAWWCPRR